MSIKWITPKGKYKIGFFDGSFKYDLDGNNREIGLRCYYPADKTEGKADTYISSEEMLEYYFKANPAGPFNDLFKELINVPTNSYNKATLTNEIKEFKVLIYTHSFGNVMWWNLVQIEELVSQGYVVFAINHTDDTFYSKLGDRVVGRDMEAAGVVMTELVKNMSIGGGKGPFEWSSEQIKEYILVCENVNARVDLWRKDTVALINEIERINSDINSLLFSKMDVKSIGAFGNSFGGAVSIDTALVDKRIAASVNLDGFQLGGKLFDNKLETPGLYLTKFAPHFEGNYGLKNDNIDCIEITGSSNLFFSDLSVLFADGVGKLEMIAPSISGLECSEVISDTLKVFFDKNIKKDANSSFDSIINKYGEKVKMLKK